VRESEWRAQGWEPAGVELPVDSGQLMVIDPCYVESGLLYESVCDTTLKDPGHGKIEEGGWVTSTTWGDGGYPLYVRRGRDGRVVEFAVDMDPDAESDGDGDPY